MAKTVRHRLITYSLPLKAICTSGGRSTIAMKPTSQNQEMTMAPIHSRRSTRRLKTSESVEARGLRVISSSRAAGPVGRMKSEEP